MTIRERNLIEAEANKHRAIAKLCGSEFELREHLTIAAALERVLLCDDTRGDDGKDD